MAFTCPKGHESEAVDFCSECGAKMVGASAPTPAAGAACPDCGSSRSEDFGVFCEVCGYNFESGAHGQIPLPPVTDPAPPARGLAWTIVAAADLSLKADESPDPPADLGEKVFSVEKEVSLIGRRSDVRGIAPDIALDFDGAVSHRHALLTRKADGALFLRDVGSSNGTKVNGAELAAMTDLALQEGDRITLGYWTALKVERR